MIINDKDLTEARTALVDVLKSTRSLTASHERMHKAHDDAHATHKACHKGCGKCDKAHESARLNRLDHRTIHGEHLAKVHSAISLLHKVLGGGPETADTTGSEARPMHALETQKLAGNLSLNKNVRTQSPFDKLASTTLQKSGVNALTQRRNPNSSNPMWNGR
jgi:hypothetical protein